MTEAAEHPSGDPTATNLAHWQELAPMHAQGKSDYYNVETLAAGRNPLQQCVQSTLESAVLDGDVNGLDVLHIQCHLGIDSVELARRGARVTGVDFSANALTEAAAIAERCGVSIDFVEGNSMDLPASLHGRFDLAYATIGVVGWIEHLDAWMASAAACLRPGGTLMLVELHPMFTMVGALDPLLVDFPYRASGPQTFDEDGSYADRDAHIEASKTIEFAHPISELIQTTVDAGLTVQRFDEYFSSEFDPRGILPRNSFGEFHLPVLDQEWPLYYGLVARKPE